MCLRGGAAEGTGHLMEALGVRRGVSSVVEHSSADPKVPSSIFQARSHTGVMDYNEACFMHLTPGVVHNFPKAVGVYNFCPLCTKRIPEASSKRAGRNSGLSYQQ